MSGGIQNIDTKSIVLELHHGGGNGNTALFLDLHPVGGGRAGVLLALDLTGLSNGSAVEKELFRQSRLTGIGVGNNSKRASTLDFGFIL